MSTHAGVLGYFGPEPRPRRTFFGAIRRMISFVIAICATTLWIALRVTLLIAGFTLIALGSSLLLLGGKRDAASRTSLWFAHVIDLVQLWIADMFLPLRRWRASRAIPVQTIS